MSTKKKIIIDTDCGSDDAWAIAMALNDPNYEILMFTCVCGNVPMAQAVKNTLTTLEYTNTYFPPVYEGSATPLVRDFVGAAETHGNDGMGDLGYCPKFLHASEGNAVLKMLDALEENPDKSIDIIALGPLTNIALAMRLKPEVMKKVNRLVVMGTAGLGTGNVTPIAEFNIWQDPESCKIVLDYFFDNLIFVGWDACIDEAMFNEEEINRISNASPLGKFIIETNQVLLNMNKERFGRPCLDMADPAAMAAALYPECIDQCDPYYCEVDIQEGPAYGGVLVDKYGFSMKTPNASICSKLKVEKFKEYVFQTLKV